MAIMKKYNCKPEDGYILNFPRSKFKGDVTKVPKFVRFSRYIDKPSIAKETKNTGLFGKKFGNEKNKKEET